MAIAEVQSTLQSGNPMGYSKVNNNSDSILHGNFCPTRELAVVLAKSDHTARAGGDARHSPNNH